MEKLNKSDLIVSAIITTFDRFEMSKRAILSVLNQTYEKIEIIVVEDGSDSGIQAWLIQQGHKDVIYFRHKKNRGLATARNTGLMLAKAEYIAYLDDDDVWKTQKIEKQVHFLDSLTKGEKNKLGVISCGIETHNPDNNYILVSYPKNSGNLKNAIIREGASTLSSVFLFSKKALEEVGGFDENLPSSIDHDIWMSLAKFGYFAYTLDEPLIINYSRKNRKTMMGDTSKRIKGVTMFVEKWLPTYQEWFGEKEGIIYCERYFAKVIAMLVGAKIIEGNISEAFIATQSIFKFSKQRIYNITILSRTVMSIVLRALLPMKYYNYLRSLKRAGKKRK